MWRECAKAIAVPGQEVSGPVVSVSWALLAYHFMGELSLHRHAAIVGEAESG